MLTGDEIWTAVLARMETTVEAAERKEPAQVERRGEGVMMYLHGGPLSS